MTTLAKLTVSMGADLAPLRRDFQAVVGETRRLAQQLGQQLRTFSTSATQAATTFTRTFQATVRPEDFRQVGERAAAGLDRGLQAGVTRSVGSIRTLLAGLGVGLGVREVVQLADSWKQVGARLQLVTASTEEFKSVQRALFAISQETRSEFSATADLYTRLARSADQLGLSSRDVLQITRTVTQALAIEGRTATETASVLLQLGQAFGSGRLQGDELRALSENASLLFSSVARHLGLTTGELRKLASDGGLSIQEFARAMLAVGGKIDEQMGRLPTTVGGALTRLRNAIQKFLGDSDEATGATRSLADAITALATAIERGSPVLETAVAALGAFGLLGVASKLLGVLTRLGGLLRAGLGAARALGAFLALIPAVTSLADVMTLAGFAASALWRAISGPIGLGVTVVGAAIAAFYKWRKGIDDAKTAAEGLNTTLAQAPHTLPVVKITALSDEAQLKAFRTETDRLVRSMEQLRGPTSDVSDLVQRSVGLYDRLTRALSSQRDRASETAVALREMRNALKGVAEVQGALRHRELTAKFPVTPVVDPAEVRTVIERALHSAPKRLPLEVSIVPPGQEAFVALKAQIRRVVDASRLLDFAELSGDKDFVAAALRRYELLAERLRDSFRNVTQGIRESGAPLEEQRRILLQIALLAAGLPASFTRTKEAVSGLQKFVALSRGIAGIAQAFGSVENRALRAASAIADAAASLAVFQEARNRKDAEGTAAPDILSQISGGLGFVGAVLQLGRALLSGASEIAREQQRILQENTRALAELRLELKGFTGSFADRAALLPQLGPIEQAARNLRDRVRSRDWAHFGESVAALDAAIRATGFSLTELAAIAKQSGITILDSEGRLIPGALEQWRQALQDASEAATRFANTLSDVQLATQLRNAANNVADTPAQVFADSAREFAQLAPRLWEQFFAGIDPGDTAAWRQAFQRFTNEFLAGLLDPADFGAFTSKDELAQFVLAWIRALNEMVNAMTEANDALKPLSNKPLGFKIERGIVKGLTEVGESLAESADALRPENLNLPSFSDLERMRGAWRFLAEFTPLQQARWLKLTGAHPEQRFQLPPTVSAPTYNFDIAIDARDKPAEVLFAEISRVAKRKARALSPSAAAGLAFDL